MMIEERTAVFPVSSPLMIGRCGLYWRSCLSSGAGGFKVYFANAILSREQPALTRLNELVAKAEKVLQDFQPSGLKPGQPAYTPFLGGF
jgi:hypothetical protein